MKKFKIGKNLPFDINKLYDIQKYIYNSQEFFIKLENQINKINKYLDSLDYRISDDDRFNNLSDLIIDFYLDITKEYSKLKNDCKLL